jgi:rhodanese-related sulfurtransferase
LSHASYLVGDTGSGRAVVVDPQRDVRQYLEAASDRELHIERVIETHVHADFLSGHLELAESTEAVRSTSDSAAGSPSPAATWRIARAGIVPPSPRHAAGARRPRRVRPARRVRGLAGGGLTGLDGRSNGDDVTIFNPNQVPEIEAVEAQSGAAAHTLLDVREPDEWEAGHAPGATWIPLGELERVRTEIPINKQVVCICRSGVRSAKAAEALISWGFDASNMVGGMRAWDAAGLPVIRDDETPGTVI